MQFQNHIIAIVLVILTVWHACSIIFSPSLFKTNILLAIPVILFLSIKRELWWMIVIALFASQATLPGLPGGLNLFHLLAAGLVAFTIPYAVIYRIEPPRKCMSRLAIYGFIGVILLTIGTRGFGLKSLGGQMGGGASYAVILTSAALALRSGLIRLSRHQWRLALLLMCAFSTLPLAAEALYTFTHGKAPFLYLFLNRNFLTALSFSLYARLGGVARLQSALHCAFPLALASLILWSASEKKYAKLGTAALIASFILAGISGHRIAIIAILLFLFTIGLLQHTEEKRPLFLIKAFASVLTALTIAAISMQHLPISVQRSLSWIPFNNVAMEAKIDATETYTWRIDVWKRAVEEVPKYLLVGRGFIVSGEDIADMQSLSRWNDLDADSFVASHSYHNGPLWLLIDTGAPGFILAVLFLFFAIKEHWHFSRGTWKDPILGRLHAILLAWLITKTVTFFTIFGDISSLVELLFLYALMEGVVTSSSHADDAAPGITLSNINTATTSPLNQ